MNRLIYMLLLACLCTSPLALADNYKEFINVTDEAGVDHSVPLKPQRIVCLTPAAAEIIYSMGESDCLVGLTDDCNMPPALLLNKEGVGKNSRSADVEKILELDPDLVIARTGALFDSQLETQIEDYGVPVIRYRALHIDKTITMIEDLGRILDEEENAQNIVNFAEEYYEMILQQVESIPEDKLPTVYFMSMGHFDWTTSSEGIGHVRITEAGGMNSAADLEGRVPHVDMEWVIEQNPEVIVYSMSSSQHEGDTPIIEEMEAKREEIMNLPGFDEIDAVQNDKVYIIDIKMATGLREIVMCLYYATWFHPEIFQDVNPRTVQEEIYQKYYGMDLEGCYAYPEA